MSDNRKLNVVDENGGILGEETRENIHNQGLLYREIHVWFYTPNGEIIFQHRAQDKDTYPNLLDATVGGHVEIGSNYEKTALQEVEEETGVKLQKDDLIFIKIDRTNFFDEQTKKRNNTLRAIYTYCYRGKVENLQIEKGKAIGFELWPLQSIFHLNVFDKDRKRFIPAIFEKQNLESFARIKELL